MSERLLREALYGWRLKQDQDCPSVIPCAVCRRHGDCVAAYWDGRVVVVEGAADSTHVYLVDGGSAIPRKRRKPRKAR